MNSKINPLLYNYYLSLKETLGACIVHRRRRTSRNCIEIIFTNGLIEDISGHVMPLREAEANGYWYILRAQTKRGHEVWRGHRVYQLYLSPVHHKKRHAAQKTADEVRFKPINPHPLPTHIIRRSVRIPVDHSASLRSVYDYRMSFCTSKKSLKICIYAIFVVPLHTNFGN